MSPNELRIGNLIYGFYDDENDEDTADICKFLGYDPFEKKYWVESESDIEAFDMFDGIPISEKWLLKFGFIKDTFMPNVFKRGDFRIVLGKDERYYFRVSGYTLSSVEYVHQLQNLFFALTNKEL